MQPPMTSDEFLAVEGAVRSAPEFVAAVRRRGIQDVSTVDIDPVAAGHYDRPEEERARGRRLARVLAYARPSLAGNAYARPLQGILGLVDVDTGELVHFEDRDPVALPPGDGEYRAGQAGPLRDDVREIRITQPDGPSFIVEGSAVHWQKWHLRVDSPAARDWSSIRWDTTTAAGCARSSIARRTPRWSCRMPIRTGSTCLRLTSVSSTSARWPSLELGCDCLGAIHYFDARAAASTAARRCSACDLPA